MGTYALIGVHLTAWVVVGALELYSTQGFWVRFAAPVFFSAVLLVIAHANVNRRFSDFFGFHDRRLGVRFTFMSLIYVQVMFALRLYGEMVGPSFEVARAMHLALVLLLTLTMLVLAVLWRHGPRRLNALSLERV